MSSHPSRPNTVTGLDAVNLNRFGPVSGRVSKERGPTSAFKDRPSHRNVVAQFDTRHERTVSVSTPGHEPIHSLSVGSTCTPADLSEGGKPGSAPTTGEHT